MKLKILIIVIFFIISSCGKGKKGSTDSIEFEVYDYVHFSKFLNKNDDKIYVINFWATWCAPCVKELPYFEKLNKAYKNVDVILVNLDFPHVYNKKLKSFIKEKKISSKVVVLDDADTNTWMAKINKDWSGSIPATVIYKNDEKRFYEKSFTYNEIEEELKLFLK